MSMVIQHNIPALQTYNIVNNTSNALQKSIAKLSSGLRINTAADDAAGLAISEKMRSQVRGLDRAVANTQDGISMIQTAEGALQEEHSILQRMRELAVQAANDTLTQQDRSYVQEEIDQLKEEITRIGNTTQFNKKKLLNGDSAGLWSSSDMETKALIKGGLREVDQFGQKKSIEGNYKIRVKADPGQAEVQKSDIMTIKHANVLTGVSINAPLGVKDVSTDEMTPGTYSLDVTYATTGAAAAAQFTGSYGIGGNQYTAEVSGAVAAVTYGTTPTAATVVAAGTGNGATAAAGAQNVYKFTLGDTELGEITVAKLGTGTGTATAEVLLNGDANYVVSGNNAVLSKAREMGYDISASGDNITIKKFGNNNFDDLKIEVTKYAGQTAANATGVGATNGGVSPTYDDTQDASVNVGNTFAMTAGTSLTKNASVLFEVTGKDATNGTVTLKATAALMDKSGNNSTQTLENIVVKQGADADTAGTKVDLSELFGMTAATGATNPGIQLYGDRLGGISEGSKFVVNFKAAGADSSATDGSATQKYALTGEIDSTWDDSWSGGVFATNKPAYELLTSAVSDTELNFKNYILNEKTGTVSQGTVTLTTDSSFKGATEAGTSNLASFTNTYIGKTANGDVRLRDLDKFWNSEGTMMLDDAKKLTLNQGDGKTADIMLYANDTLDEVATKINNAIATGLGQSKYVDDATKFATFVSAGTGLTSEAVPGTFVIRSVVPGAAGEITFSGDQGIIDAFSLNTIQDSAETTYSVDVLDEHSGKIIAQGVKTTGNVLHGVINENVDVEFGALSGVTANWSDSLKKYTYTSKQTESTLHLADNTTVLQIGANEGEDLGMDIGDMRAHALGLDGVNVMSHDRAGRSITVIDNAIDKVSTQRAKLGAYQNRLEYTASNLTTASENLTSAESRIRDADMAKEMMTFTKLNIMLQAGNSMLAQANQQPQNVLSLIR